jgi:UDP-N-acetylglucosamine diphosphorylase/glucosamine-1-phosphate N-acetyltransferase
VKSNICIFEDQGYRKLFPLTLTRPVYELRCGIKSLREKIVREYSGASVNLQCRDYLSHVLANEIKDCKINGIDGEVCLFINGRILAGRDLKEKIPVEGENKIYLSKDGELVAARVIGKVLDTLKNKLFKECCTKDHISRNDFEIAAEEIVDVKLIRYPWDLVFNNSKEIQRDFVSICNKGAIHGAVHNQAALVDPERIFIGSYTEVKPGVVLDAEEGPIYIGDNVTIFPNATIIGPASVGDGSKIKVGAKIYEGTSIGEVSKVGGEVEETIIHSFSNKQHDGFLGHSYIGSWVNLGADTNNSDLKNNYKSVKVYIDGELMDSGSTFVGLFMGDHSKSGINTMFNTGTVVGVACNVYGANFPPKFIPSFSWGAINMVEHKFDKAIETARTVMGRRKVELTKEYEAMMKKIFELTAEERKKAFG